MDDGLFREAVRAFVGRHVAPHVEDWERAGTYPAELHARAGAAGLLAYGTEPGPVPPNRPVEARILIEELTRGGSQGLAMGLASHGVSLALVAQAGTAWAEDLTRAVLAGERTVALALTEPGAGSDLAALRARAEPRADGLWSITGEKRFICNGARADALVVGARTGTGIGLFLAERPDPGLTAEAIEPSGWRCLPLAGLRFEAVPARAICGPEAAGRALQRALTQERLNLAAMAVASAEAVRDAAARHARVRIVQGAPLEAMSHVRHDLAEVATAVAVAAAFVAGTAAADGAARAAIAKNAAVAALDRAATAAVRLHGAAGCVASSLVARTLRDAPLVAIGGGTTQVMNEIIARSLAKEVC
ncbi:acyl-CoA dehydrogenase [Methylorubrum rhodinum]|uniref:Acyl-CoA dehydrogenase n=1 Tax=Methylorubrum rhodinum TaxID=29428 RepID=A0A840ZKH1_9HYPH|nr:acyl-CoA dehydrogenase family protein [Methylorubrum rhodinum]MBB5757323.1 acyl-CoA dehydrogenase [Methylorubrum rhodinum]